MQLHKIRHVLPPHGWVAVYMRKSAPWFHVIPLSDRALVTLIDDSGETEVYQDAIVGFVAHGGYRIADDMSDTDLIFVGYFNVGFEQVFGPELVEPLTNYLQRVIGFAQQSFGQPQQRSLGPVPQPEGQPDFNGELAELLAGEEDYAGIDVIQGEPTG